MLTIFKNHVAQCDSAIMDAASEVDGVALFHTIHFTNRTKTVIDMSDPIHTYRCQSKEEREQ